MPLPHAQTLGTLCEAIAGSGQEGKKLNHIRGSHANGVAAAEAGPRGPPAMVSSWWFGAGVQAGPFASPA